MEPSTGAPAIPVTVPLLLAMAVWATVLITPRLKSPHAGLPAVQQPTASIGERVQRIKPGMTLADVVGVVGVAPNNKCRLSGDGEWWWMGDWILYVRFDDDGRADRFMFHPLDKKQPADG